ncbi:MAG TPA: DNA topology modulation protein [Pyrinomonadaceae bacterium]|jgi:adenylate kinase family enzyme|nr:DNA topology modulation protein [Pyrinomonadaceae bacterium]
MRKVLVIGSGGAGKSTFSKRLGEILGVEVVHLDSLYWKPGWVETPKDVWKETIENLLKRDAWIMDGNYSGTLEMRLAACDAVIFLDIARGVCLWRVTRRALRYRNKRRPDMAPGCYEKLDMGFVEFVRWIWNYPKRSRTKILKMLQTLPADRRVFRLRSQAEVEEFLDGLEG